MSGWISLHRKLLDNPIFQKPELLQLFIYCLLKANHEENEFIFGSDLVKVKKGEFITGRFEMASDLKQKPRTTYDRLLKLEKLGYLSLKSNNKNTFVKVLKYCDYQNSNFKNQQQNDNKPTTNQQQNDTNNNDNNEINNYSLSCVEGEFLKIGRFGLVQITQADFNELETLFLKEKFTQDEAKKQVKERIEELDLKLKEGYETGCHLATLIRFSKETIRKEKNKTARVKKDADKAKSGELSPAAKEFLKYSL